MKRAIAMLATKLVVKATKKVLFSVLVIALA